MRINQMTSQVELQIEFPNHITLLLIKLICELLFEYLCWSQGRFLDKSDEECRAKKKLAQRQWQIR